MPGPSTIARGNILWNWVLSPVLSPASVANATTAEQTFAVNGLKLSDWVQVSKPTTQGGLGIVNSRVSADGVLAIAFVNTTAATITPTSAETYTLRVSRVENPTAAFASPFTFVP
jgi:hypothetical protein